MLRQSIIAAALICGLAASSSAADLPARKSIVKYNTAYTWTGFYAGAHGGYGFGETKIKGTTSTSEIFGDDQEIERRSIYPANNSLPGSHKIKGGFAGLHAGYLYQLKNNIVVGVEVEGNFANIKGKSSSASSPFMDEYDMYDYKDSWSSPSTTVVAKSKVKWFGSLRAKIGYAIDRVLVYGFAGPAYANIKYGISSGSWYDGDYSAGAQTSKNANKFGYTFGAGASYAVSDVVSVTLKYARYDFGKTRVSTSASTYYDYLQTTDYQFKSAFNTIRVGVTYKF